MGRLVYISAPNYIRENLVGDTTSIGEYFQGLAETIQDCLRVNGIDSYIASSTVRDGYARISDSVEVCADIYLNIDIDEDEANVSYNKCSSDSTDLGCTLAKKLSKINRKFKYAKCPLLDSFDIATNRDEFDDDYSIPHGYIAFTNNNISDTAYLKKYSDEIAKAIAKSICDYFGIKWEYRPHRIYTNEYKVYIPPVNNMIKARTIASSLKKQRGINAKVI